jgi:hypothetical protein
MGISANFAWKNISGLVVIQILVATLAGGQGGSRFVYNKTFNMSKDDAWGVIGVQWPIHFQVKIF